MIAKKKMFAIADKLLTIPRMSTKKISEKVGNVSVPVYPTARNGYDGFTVAWYEDGKRHRKFFADKSDARAHARLVATKIENQDRQALTISAADARVYAAALKIVGDYPLLQALQFWKRHHDDAIPDKRVSDVVKELVHGLRKDGRSESHVVEMERVLKKFAGAFHTNIGDITTADINAYLRDLDSSPASRNIYRRKIVTLFNHARRVGYLPDKTTAASKSAKAKVHSREIEIYGAQEMSRLLEHSNDNLRPFVVLCGFCGLRPAEAMRLDWKEIDFDRATVLVSAGKSKTQSRRFAPLPENAAAWLLPLAKPAGKVVNVVMIIKALKRLARRSNVKWKRNGLRHSFCSYRLAVTQNANATALEAGHSADILFRHYRQLSSEIEAKRWFSIVPVDVAHLAVVA
jgi:integrase